MKLVIGDKNLSSWSMRPWLLLKHAGIPFEEQVMLFERPEWRSEIVALSPSRRVPALHDGDLVIWDNLATMHRGRAFDDTKHRRELRRVTTLDVVPAGVAATKAAG